MRFLLSVFLVLFGVHCEAQDEKNYAPEPASAFTVAGITLHRDQYFNTGQQSTLIGGYLNVAVSDRTSLIYRASMGVNSQNKFMGQFGLNALLGSFFLNSGLQDAYSTSLFILCLIVPEGVEFHLGKPNFQISPYLIPFSLQYNARNDDTTNTIGEVGIKFHIISRSGFVFSPTVGVKNRWEDGARAVSVGLQVGFTFDK